MGAGRFVKQAKRKVMWRKFVMSRLNTCSCRSVEYGLKKGLCRACRRLDKEIVTVEQREADEEL